MANELVIPNWINNPKELVSKLDANQCLMLCDLATILTKEAIEEARKKVFASNIKELSYDLPDGRKRIVVVSRSETTRKEITRDIIDYQKAINFALDNHLHLPMVPQEIIPEHVDMNKIENEPWFQEHIDDFITQQKEVKESKSNNTIRGKYA